MKTKYLLLIIGILLVGCSAPAAATTPELQMIIITPVPPLETPTLDSPMTTNTLFPLEQATSPVAKKRDPLTGIKGMKTSGGFLWAWSENEIWRYREDEWSYFVAAPYNLNDVAYISNTLLAAVYSKLQYFDGDEWQELSKLDWDAWKIEADEKSGILWVPTSENLYRWDVEQMSYIAHPPVPCCYLDELAVTGDGSVWAGGLYGYVPTIGGLARYDDASDSWEMVRPWRAEEDVTPQLLATTPNGDLWVMLVDWSEDWEALQEAGEPFVELALAYWDSASGEWTVFEQGLPEGYPMEMAADEGGVWLAGWGMIEQMEFDGLVRFNGESWSHYLRGTEVDEVAVAPDGTVWYLTSDETLRQLQ